MEDPRVKTAQGAKASYDALYMGDQHTIRRETEKACISACLNSPKAAKLATEALEGEYFRNRCARACFEAVAAIVGEGDVPNSLSLARKLRETGRLEECGGYSAVMELMDNTYSVVMCRSYFRWLIEDHARDVLAKAGGLCTALAARGEDPADIEAGLAETGLEVRALLAKAGSLA